MRRRDLSLVVVAVGVALIAVAVITDDDSRDRADRPDRASSTTEDTAPAEPRAGRVGADGVGDPYFPGLGNGGYDVEHYDLTLQWDAPQLTGIAEIGAVATQDLDRFNLDLVGLEALEVQVDDGVAEHVHDGRELVVTPGAPIEDGERFVVEVRYQGQPAPISEGTGIFDVGWHVDGDEVFVVNEPSGAATFFPANDHPSDKATFTFRIDAPEEQTVAANGRRVGEPEVTAATGTRRWTYEMADPMATYLVQVAIGDYELVTAPTVGGVEIRHALHRSGIDRARTTVESTGELLTFLTELFGPYPFDVYGVVAVDEQLGFALETQTLTLIGSDIAAEGEDAAPVMLHELAHHWFGDSVTPATWKDIWLNEGFATYAEWLYAERRGGTNPAELARRLGAMGPGSDLDVPAGDPGPDEIFGPTVYQRGALTLHALRDAIGDDAFFELLRRWASEHEHDVVSTDDFIALAEEVSGTELDPLFEAWLYAPELPSLS